MKKLFYALATFLIFSFQFSICSAQTVQIYRSGTAVGIPHSTLASAIAAAINGDSLKLSSHTFYEHDVVINKNLVITGTYFGPDSTTINAQSLGRVLLAKSRYITLRDLIITNGKVSGTSLPTSINNGGGIRIDTFGLLTLSGRTIVRNNSASGGGGGIGGVVFSSSGLDSMVLRLKEHTIISNNSAGSNGALAISVGARTKIYLTDDVVIYGNTSTNINGGVGGVGAHIVIVEGTGSEGGVRLMYNKSARDCGGLKADTLYLNGTLTVSHNMADSNGGGIWRIGYIYGSGKLDVHNNSAYLGGGASELNYLGGNQATVLLHDNRAKFGGGLSYLNAGGGGYNNGIQIFNNTADSAGGGVYAIHKNTSSASLILNFERANIYNNKAAKYNGMFGQALGSIPVGFVLRKCRLFNPLSSGAHSNEEVYVYNNCYLEADSCWFGESDTTGLLRKDASSSISLTRTVKCEWQINNGVPVTHFPFPLTARFKLSTGAPMPMGSFQMLEGRFSGSMGAFTPAISLINTSNNVESIYKATSSGSASIMGIIDADTFKANLTVSGIEELGFEQVKIYPNPATDVIYLQGVEAGSTSELYDITGKLVKREQLMNTNAQVDIKSFPSGIFNLKITNKAGQIGNAKVVKQ